MAEAASEQGAPLLFTEARFLAFFLVVFGVHWALRGVRARKVWLLFASYAFYAAWDWRFLSLLWFSTAVDYGCARAMRDPERKARRPWLVTSLLTSLALLGFFKYFGFFVDSAVALARAAGVPWSPATLAIVLPIGISFYTFQSMSYTLDVYRGRIAPVRDALDFALFVGFFPQLGAGPIARGAHFLPQLATPRRFERVAWRAALGLFLVGFAKKACVADGIAALVDPVFAAPGAWSCSGAWSALFLYHVQIYCDFSGYTDMAIATAALLGYELPRNFDFPYLARGIGEFWRRWHISLSTWMRDYLFLPLLGRQPSAGRRRWALFVTMGLCGLWHGAGWPFVGFGLLHGAYLVLEELWKASGLRRGVLGRLTGWLACPALNVLVLLTWPVFRVSDWDAARALFGVLFGQQAGAGTIDARQLLVVPLFVLAHLTFRERLPARWLATRSPVLVAALYGLAWALVLPLVADDFASFIYFQF